MTKLISTIRIGLALMCIFLACCVEDVPEPLSEEEVLATLISPEPQPGEVDKEGDVENHADEAEEDMMLIPAGEFQMGDAFNEGDDDERPVHTVYLDAFYMDKYEVTNAQFKKFVEANPEWSKDGIDPRYHDGCYLLDWNGNDYPEGKGDYPVIWVSWYAAAAYAQWAGKRLPTEAEWEKAARGGLVGKRYPWGDEILYDEVSSWGTGGRDIWDETSPVGSFPPNGYGIYDMAGNVLEWCADLYDSGYYQVSPERNPIGPGSGSYCVLRGGSWLGTSDLRCASRDCELPSYTDLAVGIRCAW